MTAGWIVTGYAQGPKGEHWATLGVFEGGTVADAEKLITMDLRSQGCEGRIQFVATPGAAQDEGAPS